MFVIKKAEKIWLPDIRDALLKQMRISINNKTWAISANPVIVLNADMARGKGIIE